MRQHKHSRNPLLPLDCHFPDCEARVMPDGRLYLYGSCDEQAGAYCSDRYFVASTDDLENWTIHDQSFSAAQAPWATSKVPTRSFLDRASSYETIPDYIKKNFPPQMMDMPFPEFKKLARSYLETCQDAFTSEIKLYAPDAIYRDGRFYLYMCFSDDSEGVAVSDRPQGPFADAVKLPVQGIDPAVFVDDDNQAYYYWGQFSASGAQLNSDMMSIDEQTICTDLLTEKTHHFHEGSSLRKRGDTYYFVFADISRGKPTALGYATSRLPMGPFTYRGVIIDNNGCDPETWNNHGSIERFNGQWYVFYHRSSQRSNSMRRVCAEPIQFLEDGTIPEVRMTSQGAGQPFGPGETIPAFTVCDMSGGLYLAPLGESEALVNISDGDKAVFRYFENNCPVSSIRLSAQGSGYMEVWADGCLCGMVDLLEKGADIDLEPGLHEIALVFRGTSNCILQEICLS